MVNEIADGDCGRTTGAETPEEKEEVDIVNGHLWLRYQLVDAITHTFK